jgi:hypothetical protein
LLAFLCRFGLEEANGYRRLQKLSPQWLEYRAANRLLKISASRLAPALGVDPYCSLAKAYREAIGPSDNLDPVAMQHMFRGRVVEPAILNRLRSFVRFPMFDDLGCWERAGMTSTPDAVIWDFKARDPTEAWVDVEAKSVERLTRWDPLPPIDKLVQVQGQLYAQNQKLGLLVASSADEFRIYRVLFSLPFWEDVAIPGGRYFLGRIHTRQEPPRQTDRKALVDLTTKHLSASTQLVFTDEPGEEIEQALRVVEEWKDR